MRNALKWLPVRSAILLFTMLPAILFLANFQSANPPHTVAKAHFDLEQRGPVLNEQSDTPVANCRYGTSANQHEAHVLPTIGAGIFYDWRVDWPFPRPANNAEFMHMIRTRQVKSDTGEYLQDWYSSDKLGDALANVIGGDPGSIWIIGNEPERGPNPGETFTRRTDDIHADMYAEAYHEIYHFIKGVDPTARITNAGLIQITPMRLQYLDLMWEAYERKYNAPMPVDIWTMHAYVMPETTPDGQPNNIASTALGTDISLGKRASGGDASKCSDPDVFCFAEHDDLRLLEEQVVAMRQWMKEHDQQNKPLIVTEYSTLYHYIFKEDGTCQGLKDENGECFTPQRVSKFMVDTFDYFNSAKDPTLGMPLDNNKLVQQWIWYDAWAWDIGSSNLLNDDLKTLNLLGKTFRDQVMAQPRYVDLTIEKAAATIISYDHKDKAQAQLSVKLRNNGNASIAKPFTVTFFKDPSLSEPIGSVTVSAMIRGCATDDYTATIDWRGLSKGSYKFWVEIDHANSIAEKNEADNRASGLLEVAGPADPNVHSIFNPLIARRP